MKPAPKTSGASARPYREFRAHAGTSIIHYGFSTRQAGYPDFYAVLKKRGPVTVPEQTHSANIHQAKGRAPRQIPDCDALITRETGQTLTVRTADCLPIFLWDAKGKAVAIVHAGWKGTHQKIAAKTVARLKRLGVKPADLRAVFGPAIRSCCYEVGPEFVDRFPVQTLVPGRPGHWRFDNALANRLQLEAAGVPSKRIRDLKLCTACDTRTFFSYRREAAQTGRMISWICLSAGKNANTLSSSYERAVRKARTELKNGQTVRWLDFKKTLPASK